MCTDDAFNGYHVMSAHFLTLKYAKSKKNGNYQEGTYTIINMHTTSK